jgi:NADPH-ferrihemoprotein reductase
VFSSLLHNPRLHTIITLLNIASGKPIGETVLYFGCRRKAQDFIYREELEKYHEEGAVTELNLAFSRDQDHKVYVQHLMRNNMEKIYKLLEDGAHIYVCG